MAVISGRPIEPVTDQGYSSYAVKLPAFEGPLDLLLHLIRKNEINITDIPINVITQQYLETLGLMQSLNLSIAGEFLVMAATLVHIKSRELLPPAESEPEADDDDPRAVLVARLVEYQRFKDASQRLEEREAIWREIFPGRPIHLDADADTELPLSEVSLFDLLDALRGVVARLPERRDLEIVVEGLTVQERMNTVLDRLQQEESVSFTGLFDRDTTRNDVIVTLLALLELARLNLVRIVQPQTFGAIRVWRTESLTPS